MAGALVSTRRLVPAGGRAAVRGETISGRSPLRLPAQVDEAPDPVHERGVGEILDTALDVLFARFGPCVGFATLFLLPFRVGSEFLTMDQRFLWEVTYTLPELLTTAFVCSLVGGHFLGRRVSAAEAFREGIVALPGVAVIALLQVGVLVGLICMCVVPALFGYWAFAVIPTVYVLERARLVQRAQGVPGTRWVLGIVLSLARGMRLVFDPGAFGRWLGWALVGILAVYLPLTLSSGLLEQPEVRNRLHESFAMQSRAVWFWLAAIGAVFAGIGTAYLAILKTVYYLDQRVRREALDLELALDRRERRSADAGQGAPGPA